MPYQLVWWHAKFSLVYLISVNIFVLLFKSHYPYKAATYMNHHPGLWVKVKYQADHHVS